MSDIDWMLDDLHALRKRFREARLAYPGLISKFARFPHDGNVWHMKGWQQVQSFASIGESDGDLSSFEAPCINFLFLKMAETCLTRTPGAGWSLQEAVASFGELALATVATLRLCEATRIMVEWFWWNCDERAWIAWLHQEFPSPAHEELAVGQDADARFCGDDTNFISGEVPVTQIDDVFEASCRLLDRMIRAIEDVSLPLQLGDEALASSPHELQVVLDPPQIKLEGTVYQVSPDGALFVQTLIDAKGDWRAGNKMDMRADRVRAALPDPIRKLIEASPGKGYRLVSPAGEGA